MFQQAVDGGNCGKGFTGTRSHLNQSLGFVGGKRLLQIVDGCDLAFAKSSCIKIRKPLHAVANSIRLFQ